MPPHTCPTWRSLHIQRKVKAKRKAFTKGYFESWSDKQCQRHVKRSRRQKIDLDPARSSTMTPLVCVVPPRNNVRLLSCLIAVALADACLFLINPFLNYRAEGECRTASAWIFPNEPPPLSSPPASCLPLLSGLCFCLHLCLPHFCCFMPAKPSTKVQNTAKRKMLNMCIFVDMNKHIDLFGHTTKASIIPGNVSIQALLNASNVPTYLF